MTRFFLIFCSLLTLAGCEKNTTTTSAEPAIWSASSPAKTNTSLLMHEPVETQEFELPSEAIQAWRNHKASKPALALFSLHPFLESTPKELEESITQLVDTGSPQDFRASSTLERANPLVLPLQTVSVALDQKLISSLTWFFATRTPLDEFTLDTILPSMQEGNFVSPEEAKSFKLEDTGIISGMVRNVPILIVHPLAQIPKISNPMLLHVDLGYFKGLYKNEVSTPLYNLLEETVQALKDSGWQTVAATLSYSTEDAAFSLDVRFLISALAELLRNPGMRSGKMPEAWTMRRDALNKREMFLEKDAKRIFMEAAEKFPQSASTLYDAYRVLLNAGKIEEAFSLLDRIVALDRGYAQEYLSLARVGMENGWYQQTLMLLEKSAEIYPVNPFIALNMFDVLMALDRKDEALSILEDLQKLAWSKYYYPDMPHTLSELKTAAIIPEPDKNPTK